MKRTLPSIHLLIVALLVVNVLALGAEGFIRWKIRRSSEPILPGSVFAPLAGVARSGALWRGAADAAPTCHVVRFASSHCAACKPAQARGYVLLARALADRGCDAIVLSPNGSDLPMDGEGPFPQEMMAVDLRFVAASGFTATPTTVVFDRDWKVLWSSVGAFSEDSARTALRTIR